jgi:chemotaxis regulatin CheY-phosphate phosphatase CheZ
VSDVKVTLDDHAAQELQKLLQRVGETQREFWDALRDFEDYAASCGHPIELTSTNDYIDYSVAPSREAVEAVLDGYGNEDDLAE